MATQTETQKPYKIASIVLGVLLIVALIGAGFAYNKPAEIKTVTNTVEKIVADQAVLDANKQLSADNEALTSELNDLKAEFKGDLTNFAAYGQVTAWAEGLKLADKYDDELALALNITDKDLLEDYTF